MALGMAVSIVTLDSYALSVFHAHSTEILMIRMTFRNF